MTAELLVLFAAGAGFAAGRAWQWLVNVRRILAHRQSRNRKRP